MWGWPGAGLDDASFLPVNIRHSCSPSRAYTRPMAPPSASSAGPLPLVLRARGMALADVGLLQLIYLPIGIAFVWAPLIDRLRPSRPPASDRLDRRRPRDDRRTACSSQPGDHLANSHSFMLAFGTSITMATADIALEALIVETVGLHRRPLVTTTKLSGSAIGTMVGVALATMFSAHVDLRGQSLSWRLSMPAFCCRYCAIRNDSGAFLFLPRFGSARPASVWASWSGARPCWVSSSRRRS